MKKFLRLELPSANREIPPELDASILAAAAMRAKSTRKKRLSLKITALGITSAGAAAAAVLTVLPMSTPAHHEAVKDQNVLRSVASSPVVIAAEKNTLPLTPKKTTAELLALADTTLLEQESYNLATMADFSLDGDNFTM